MSDDIEKMKEWFKKKYPDYAHMAENIELVRRLYEKEHGRGKRVSGVSAEEVKIKELPAYVNKVVEIEGIVTRIYDVIKYMGCPKCNRKNCDCDVDKTELYLHSAEVGDETGFAYIMLRPSTNNKIDFDVGDVIRARGRVKKWKDDYELNVFEYKILKKGQITAKTEIDYVIDKLKTLGEMRMKSFIELIMSRGIKLDEVRDKIEIIKTDDGKEWVRLRE